MNCYKFDIQYFADSGGLYSDFNQNETTKLFEMSLPHLRMFSAIVNSLL